MTASADYNVVSIFAQTSGRYGSRSALVLRSDNRSETSVTFDELWEQIDRTSVGLRQAGMGQGDRAILMIPMSIDLYVLLLAVLKCGAIGLFIDPWIGRAQIAAYASFTKASAWIGVPKSHLLRLSNSTLRRIPLSVTSGRRWWGLGGRVSLSELERAKGDGVIAPVNLDTTAMITFTSGSSGLPKGVNRTHGFLTAQHEALQEEFPQRDDDVDMPMFPVFALNNLARGIPSIIPSMDFRHVDRIDAKVIGEQMSRHGVTTCTASPPFIDRLARYQVTQSEQKHPLRRILTGGAPVSDQQLAAWRHTWPDTELVVVYGSTEAEPVGHINANTRLTLQPTPPRPATGFCIGRPSSQVRLRVVRIHTGPIQLDSKGWEAWELPCGEAGELVVSGKHVARAYYQNRSATEENKIIDAEGAVWHRMGDTGYVDEAGYVWLVGRVHSTIWRDGRAVHPQLIEQAGVGNESNSRVAAIGLPDESLGERVVVVVEGSADLAEVRERIVAAGLCVDEIRRAESPLPLDPRHRAKIDYAALKRQPGSSP